MLLFIGCFLRGMECRYEFQYISCYCLSLSVSILAFVCGNFNTSHVTVYLNVCIFTRKAIKFQYISCYCLSTIQLLKQMHGKDFNTSHVTVYLGHSCCHIEQSQFQYISCYCLSFAATSPSNLFLIFQYISCYCLSISLTFPAIPS